VNYLKHIYLDESGNLGFSEKSGKYFIVAGLCVEDSKTVDRCIKNARTGLTKKYKKNELKFSNSSDPNKRRVLSCISKRDVSLSYLALNKNWVPIDLRQNIPLLHTYMSGQLLSNVLSNMSVIRINVIIDKFLHSKKIDGFNDYIDNNVSVKMNIQHVSSDGNNSIQAVDFVAGAVNRKYRGNDDEYYKLIEDKIDIILDSRDQILGRVISNIRRTRSY
jgi:hypothetical protein